MAPHLFWLKPDSLFTLLPRHECRGYFPGINNSPIMDFIISPDLPAPTHGARRVGREIYIKNRFGFSPTHGERQIYFFNSNPYFLIKSSYSSANVFFL